MRASIKKILLGRIPKCFAAFAALACFTSGLQAQISVSAFGTAVDGFATIPPASSWATRSDPGNGNSYGSTASLPNFDPFINGPTNGASTITAQVGNNTGTPPLAAAGTAQYSTVGQFLQTRPTVNAGTFLMASLRNDSGGGITSFDVTYVLTDAGAPGTTAESTPGHRVYYNLGGAAGNWVSLGDHWGADNAANQSITIPVALGSPWAPGTINYLLFVDPNSLGNPDAINEIDNFQIVNVVGGVVTCPGITNQPQNVTLQQCPASTATFSISVTGSVQGIQWYLSNSVAGFQAIAGANSASYTTPPATLSDSGSLFRAIATNSSCSATSTVAKLTVAADTTPPAPLFAVTYDIRTSRAANTLTNVTVVFSEPINTNNPDLWSNWTLSDTNTGGQVAILGQVYINSMTVLLETDSSDPSGTLDPTHGYALDLQLVFDACANNELPFTTIPVKSFQNTILSTDASTIWRFNEDNVDLGTAWRAPGFDDSTWLTGAGAFDAKKNTAGPGSCGVRTTIGGLPIRTCLTLSNAAGTAEIPTIYFRKQFTYSGDTSVVLQLRSVVDDGMVLYLNGVDVFRLGMPTGPITFTTAASRTVGDGTNETNYVSATLLNGVNTLAVELHNVNLTGSDLSFALDIDTISATKSAVRPVMSVSRNGGATTITWTPPIGTLQRSPDISSPANWVNVPGASSPFITNAPPAIQFFRVTVP
jgi:hypothetical protein